MTLTLTKTAPNVFAPTTSGGAPRGASMDEVRTWGTEIEGIVGQHQDLLDDIANPPMRYDAEIAVTATVALANGDIGALIKINAASAPTVTLPPTTLADALLVTTLINLGSTAATLQGATVSSTQQTIAGLEDGSTAGSFTLLPGMRATLVVNASGSGYTIVVIGRKTGTAAGAGVVVASDGYLPALDGRRLINLPVTTQSQRTVLKLGSGYINGGGKAGAVIIASDGWAYAAGVTPINGNNVAARPIFMPLRLTPGEVAPSLPFVKAVRTANSIYLLDSLGVVYCCGGNASGQLGQGDTTNRPSLVRMSWFVSNGITVADIIPQRIGYATDAAETVYFMGSASGIDRGVWAVGRNDGGQLGNGSTINSTPRSTPVRVGSLTTITKVRACGASVGAAMALTASGDLYMWGCNDSGIAADGTTTAKASPILTLTGVMDFDLGMSIYSSAWYQYAVALISSDKTMRAIGYGANGQFGTGSTTSSLAWVQPVLGFTNAASIHALNGGVFATTAIITADSKLKLCGDNDFGQQGVGNTTDQLTFHEPSFAGQGKISKVLGGGVESAEGIFALDTDGVLWAAGCGTYGALGSALSSVPATQSTFTRMPLPATETVADFEISPSAAATAVYGVLAKSQTGQLYATGYNDLGQLGLGHTQTIVDGFELVRL
ncbi:RCC1 domain-containing protein [Pleomorphomonas oryzae]|uniref:RCC1 domain-containing protein n=1 Tax=Pleomorphomonas oryzae TaxID=261934 RepID=UPI0004292861|nr:hypothetical protein [Pleomorphomonas oryzae]